MFVWWYCFFITTQKKALPRNMGEIGFLCVIASACGRSMFKWFVHVHAILQNALGITASRFHAAWFRAGLCVELGVDRLCTWKFYGSSSKPKLHCQKSYNSLKGNAHFCITTCHSSPLIHCTSAPGSSFPRRHACAACLDVAALRRTAPRGLPKGASESWHDDGLWRYGEWATVSRFLKDS